MKFLRARWDHLLLANYSVDPDVLRPYVPAGTTLDIFEGHAFVSLVAFYFHRTRILGLPVPFFSAFEEVNLRFYVSPEADRTKRAVTFIKEIVPIRVIPLVANTLFHENYCAMPMTHRNEEHEHEYTWGNGGRTATKHRFAATIGVEESYPDVGSVGEFITEHYWGYAQGPHRTLEYQVEHPQWKCRPVECYEIDVDYAACYGPDFGFLTEQEPHNVQYAVGSEVSVSFPGRLQ